MLQWYKTQPIGVALIGLALLAGMALHGAASAQPPDAGFAMDPQPVASPGDVWLPGPPVTVAYGRMQGRIRAATVLRVPPPDVEQRQRRLAALERLRTDIEDAWGEAEDNEAYASLALELASGIEHLVQYELQHDRRTLNVESPDSRVLPSPPSGHPYWATRAVAGDVALGALSRTAGQIPPELGLDLARLARLQTVRSGVVEFCPERRHRMAEAWMKLLHGVNETQIEPAAAPTVAAPAELIPRDMFMGTPAEYRAHLAAYEDGLRRRKQMAEKQRELAVRARIVDGARRFMIDAYGGMPTAADDEELQELLGQYASPADREHILDGIRQRQQRREQTDQADSNNESAATPVQPAPPTAP